MNKGWQTRRPIRLQLMLPMLMLVVLSLMGASLVNAWMAARAARMDIERQMERIAKTLGESSFPLTKPVLNQMQGLSGVDFLLVDKTGQLRATTFDQEQADRWLASADLAIPSGVSEIIDYGAGRYFHLPVEFGEGTQQAAGSLLHMLYPEASFRESRNRALWPPLWTGLFACSLSILLAVLIANRLSKPILRLKDQVQNIASGQFVSLSSESTNDEIRDLSEAINQMASRLSLYEAEVRKSERLETLAQLGRGMAHQLRNSATGCRMAIDIMASRFDIDRQTECLQVALRQLEMMDRYLRTFLEMNNKSNRRPFSLTDPRQVVDHVLPLLRPLAAHGGVRIQSDFPATPVRILADPDQLEQLVVNLVVNAIEAVTDSGASDGEVVIRLDSAGNGRVFLEVSDTGQGPDKRIEQKIFEPFVTDKADGIGLGLSIVAQIAEAHGGSIEWDRESGRTRFRANFPLATEEQEFGTTAGGG